MHDSFLMQNISKEIKNICKNNNFKRVNYLQISVCPSSHITEENLLEHLKDLNGEAIDKDTNIEVVYEDDIEELTAVIKKIEGEKEETQI